MPFTFVSVTFLSSSIAFPATHSSQALLAYLFFFKQTHLAPAFALVFPYRELLPSRLFHGLLPRFLGIYSDATF